MGSKFSRTGKWEIGNLTFERELQMIVTRGKFSTRGFWESFYLRNLIYDTVPASCADGRFTRFCRSTAIFYKCCAKQKTSKIASKAYPNHNTRTINKAIKHPTKITMTPSYQHTTTTPSSIGSDEEQGPVIQTRL